MIATDSAYIYSAGRFKKRSDAVTYLNEAIDQGYPDATMVERSNMEYLVQDNSSSDPYGTVMYTIQFMALRNPQEISYFSDLDQVTKFGGEDGLYRYVTGRFENIDQVMDELTAVRKKGYKDAFVIPTSRFEAMAQS